MGLSLPSGISFYFHYLLKDQYPNIVILSDPGVLSFDIGMCGVKVQHTQL